MVIDLEGFPDNFEDAFDMITYYLHKDDPRESLEEVRSKLISKGKLLKKHD